MTAALLLCAAGCGHGPGSPDTEGENPGDDLGGALGSAGGATSACEAAGGACVALTPSACQGGAWGPADACGSGLGVGCCLPGEAPPPTSQCEPLPAPNGGANPAAAYCEALGYAVSTVTTQGGEDSWCTFPDGTGCPAWSFFRGACGQAFSFCNRNGGQVSAVTEDMGGWMGEYALCTLADGSSCKEWDYSTTCACP